MGKKKVSKNEKRLYQIGNFSPVQKPLGPAPVIPRDLLLESGQDPGVFFGGMGQYAEYRYVGMPQGTDGNVMVIGGNGSGKSSSIAMPTLRTWRGAICAMDVKGELSECYQSLFDEGLCSGNIIRPFFVFDPTYADGPSYNPFWWLLKDGDANLVTNVQQLASAIVPVLPDDTQPFWAETEQGVLAAALLYYFQLGLSFSEAMCLIAKSPVSSLCKELSESGDIRVQMLIGEAADLKAETLACIDRGLRNKIMLFATDSCIAHAFRGEREGAVCFNWGDLANYNIFLRIPEDKLDQWGRAINLMCAQLLSYLARRPEKYSEAGINNVQTLLMLDEFPCLGKLEAIPTAIATLRSKNVNVCLMVQSVAQLDAIYGEYNRRIMFDNCQFQVILRASDADTEKYLCDRIGTSIHAQHSASKHLDKSLRTTGYNAQVSEIRDWVVQPYELSTLDEIVLLTPYGDYRVEKFQSYRDSWITEPTLISIEEVGSRGMIPRTRAEKLEMDKFWNLLFDKRMNEDAKIMSVYERTANAVRRASAAKQQQRIEQRQVRESLKKQQQRRNYVIGELVTKYFPEVAAFEPGTLAENEIAFAPLEAFLSVLADETDLVESIKDKAHKKLSQCDQVTPIALSVSGPMTHGAEGGVDCG